MRELNEIKGIIGKLTDKQFERINEADGAAYFGTTATERKNGRRRLVRNLKAIGLTVDEWNTWAAE